MNRTIQPPIQQIDNFSILTPQNFCFSNGIPVSIINASEQEVIRLDFVFEGGRWRQTSKLQSIFTNRMLKEGTETYTSKEIAEKLDYYGAWLELSSSADYEYITLYSLNKYFNQTIDIIESMIKEPLFSEKELDIVINANINQFLINNSKVDFITHRQLLNQLYGDNHPCGNLVNLDDYTNINSDILKSFHNAYYHSKGCAIFLSGKINDDIIKRVEKSFGNNTFGRLQSNSSLPSFSILPSIDKRLFINQPNAVQSSIKLGGLTIPRHHPDYLKFRVLLKVFGGYFGSRLMTNIREDKGYTYGISSGTLFYPDSALLIINTEADSQYVECLIQEIYNEIDKLQTTQISTEELTMVKNYMIGEACRGYESPFSLADAWIFAYTSRLDKEYFNRALQAIQLVTSEELQVLANKHLCKETLKEVIAGKNEL